MAPNRLQNKTVFTLAVLGRRPVSNIVYDSLPTSPYFPESYFLTHIGSWYKVRPPFDIFRTPDPIYMHIFRNLLGKITCCDFRRDLDSASIFKNIERGIKRTLAVPAVICTYNVHTWTCNNRLNNFIFKKIEISGKRKYYYSCRW